MARIVKCDPIEPQAEIIAQAAGILLNGGLVVYPTRCLYGLGADATNPLAVAKVFDVKGRPRNQPVSVLCPDEAALEAIVRHVPPLAQRIMARFWPGSVTIVLEANDTLPPGLIAGTGKIGVRRPAHPLAAALVGALGRPITATSANLSGSAGCFRIGDLPHAILQRVDLVLDAGDLEGGTGSTVVDATGAQPLILREGVVSAEEIRSIGRRDF